MIGDLIADRYELLEICGTGGMSTVYKAHDQLLERNVALKVLHPHYGDDEEYVERFRREARAVAQLSHPNIVTVIDRGEADGHQFIVFEFIDGENLKELVGRTGPLPVRRALELGIAVADGLAFAHEHGLVHRDVKPQNVLLNGDGEAKVTDFGIARSLDVERGVTQTGTVMGTSNYLSPEQANGQPVTPATDVYSLGVVLFEMLTADVPFPGENFVAVAMKHLNDTPPDILAIRPDVPLRLASALDRALEKDAARRFASMDELARELRHTLAELGSFDDEHTFVAPSQVLRESSPHVVRARRPRWPLYLLLAVIAAAAIAAGALTLGGSNGKHRGKGGGGQAGGPVALSAVSGYDPQGTGGEHDTDASKATDGNPSTFWYTEHYSSSAFGGLKNGVGLVLDAGHAAKVSRITVASATPGFTAQIESGASASGPFTPVSSKETVNSSTTFTLPGTTARYYVVWITSLGAHASVDVNEVRATG
jgi:eukaryotic-like serine/threonine-protein kinase